MKQSLLDVIKWSLILVVAGTVFYVVCPKYHFASSNSGLIVCRGNKITGGVEFSRGKVWKAWGKRWEQK